MHTSKENHLDFPTSQSLREAKESKKKKARMLSTINKLNHIKEPKTFECLKRAELNNILAPTSPGAR